MKYGVNLFHLIQCLLFLLTLNRQNYNLFRLPVYFAYYLMNCLHPVSFDIIRFCRCPLGSTSHEKMHFAEGIVVASVIGLFVMLWDLMH